MANNESLFGNFDLFGAPDKGTQKEVESLYKAPKAAKDVELSSGARQIISQVERSGQEVARASQAVIQEQSRLAEQSARSAMQSQQEILREAERYSLEQQRLEEAQQREVEATSQERQQALEKQIYEEAKAREAAAEAERKRLEELAETAATNPEVLFSQGFNNILNGKDDTFEAMGTLEQKYELARQLNAMEEELKATLPEDQANQIMRVAKSKAGGLLADKREAADDFFVTDWLRGAQQMVKKRGIVSDSAELTDLTVAQAMLEGKPWDTGERITTGDSNVDATRSTVLWRTANRLQEGLEKLYGDEAPTKREIAATLSGSPSYLMDGLFPSTDDLDEASKRLPLIKDEVAKKISKYIETRVPSVEADIGKSEEAIAKLDSRMSPQTKDEKLNTAYEKQRNLARYAGEDAKAEAQGGRSVTEEMWSDTKRLGDTASIAWKNRMSMSVDSAGPMAVAAVAGAVARQARLIPGITVRQSGAIALASGRVVGAEQFQQEVASGAREAILNTPLEQLEKNPDWKVYVEAAGGNPEVAKRRLAASATTSAYEDNFAIGLAVNMFGLEALTAKVSSRVLSETAGSTAKQIVGRSALAGAGTVLSEGVEEGSTRLRTNMVLQEDAYRTNPKLYGTEYRAKIFEGVADDAVTGMVLGGVMSGGPIAIDTGRQLYNTRTVAARRGLQNGVNGGGTSGGAGVDLGADPAAPINENQQAQFLATSFFRDLPTEQRYAKLRNMYKNRGFVDTQELKQAWHEATQDMTVEQTQALYDAIDTEANLNVMTTPEQRAELASFMSNEIERAYDATDPNAQKKVNTNPFKLAGRTPAQRAFLDNDASVVVDPLTANAIALRDGKALPTGEDLELSMAIKDALEMTSAGDVDSTGKRSFDWLHVYNKIKQNAPDLTMEQREKLAVWARDNLNATAERMTDAELATFQQSTAGSNTSVTALPATTAQGPNVSYVPTAVTPTGTVINSSVPVPTTPFTPATTTQTTPYLATLPTGATNATSQSQTGQTTAAASGQTTGTNVAGTVATPNLQSNGNNAAPQVTATTNTAITPAETSTGVVSDTTISAITQASRQIQNDAATTQESSGTSASTGVNVASAEGTGRTRSVDVGPTQTDIGTGSVGVEAAERNTNDQRAATPTQARLNSLLGQNVSYRGQSGRLTARDGNYVIYPTDGSPEVIVSPIDNLVDAEALRVRPAPLPTHQYLDQKLTALANGETSAKSVLDLLAEQLPEGVDPVSDPLELTTAETVEYANAVIDLADSYLGVEDSLALQRQILDILGTDATPLQIMEQITNVIEQIETATGTNSGTDTLSTQRVSGTSQENNSGQLSQEAENALLNVTQAELDTALGILTDSELAALDAQAEAAGMSLTDWVRQQLPIANDGVIADIREYLLEERGIQGDAVDIAEVTRPANETTSPQELEAAVSEAIEALPAEERAVVEEAILLKEEELRTQRLQEIGTLYNDARNAREQVLNELEALSAQRRRDTNESSRSAKRRNAQYDALKSELDALENAMTRLEEEIGTIPPARVTALRLPQTRTDTTTTTDIDTRSEPEQDAQVMGMLDRLAHMQQEFEDARTNPNRNDAINAVIEDSIFGRVTARLRSIVAKILNNLGKILAGVAVVSVVVAGSTDARAQTDVQTTVPITQTIQGVSAPTNAVNNYVQQNNDADGKPYVVADKKSGSIAVFNSDGTLRSTAPAIYGRDTSDAAVPGATPAGKFELKFERTDAKGYSGSRQTFLKNEATRDGKPVMEVFSLHRVYTRNKGENRQQRLDTPTSSDNRISNGCINVPTNFYNENFNGDFDGYIYVIPETGRYTGNTFGTTNSGAESATAGQRPVNRINPEPISVVPVPEQEARTEDTSVATSAPETQAVTPATVSYTEAEREAIRVTSQPTATVTVDAITAEPVRDGTDSIIAVGTAAVIEGTTPSSQVALVETIQQDGVGYSMVAVPEGQLTPAEQTIEPVFDTQPSVSLAGVVLGVLGALGIGKVVAARRRTKLTKANAKTRIFTPITTPPLAPRPLAPTQLPMPQPLVVAPASPKHQKMLDEQQAREQTYQAEWFSYMAESGQVAQDIFTDQMLDAANSFIGDVFVDGSTRYSQLSGKDVAKKYWRGMFPFGLGEGFTFWGLRFSGGAMPRLDNHLVKNGAPRFGIEPDSTTFGTALAGAKTKATQAFEIMQQRYLKPVDDYLMDISAKTDIPLAEVEEDFGNYATVQHLLNEGYEQHYASMEADIQEVQDKIDAMEAQKAAAVPGSREAQKADEYISAFMDKRKTLENKLTKTRSMTEGTIPWDGKTRIMGGRTRAESQAIADEILAKYDPADVERGDALIKRAIRDIKNYSVSAGGIDSTAARRYAQSGFDEYVPLYSVPKTNEDLEAELDEDSELESSAWEDLLSRFPESEVRSLGLAYDPSRLRRKGARNPSDHAINNMRKFAYTQSDLIAQAPVKTAITQLFELELQELTNLTPAESAEYKELRSRAVEDLTDADQLRIRELETLSEPTPQQVADVLEKLNDGTGGNSSIPGIERYRRGDPRADKFKRKKGAAIRPITAKGHNAEGVELEYEYYFTDRVLQNEVYNNLPVGARNENKVVAQIRSTTRGASRLMTQLRPIWNIYAYEKEAIERGMNIMFRDLVDADGNKVDNAATAAVYARKNAEIAKGLPEIYRYLVHREIKTPLQRSLAKAQASGAIQLYTDVLDKTQSRENRQESWSTEAINWLGDKAESKLRGSKAGTKVGDGAELATNLYMKGMVEVPQVVAALSMYQALEEVGVTRKEAANRTRDMFDPARGPEWQSNLSAFYPFLRSAMAGNYTTWRSLTQDGWKGWTKFGVSVSAMLGILFIAGALIGDDDDGVPKLASMNSIRGIPIRAPWLGEDAVYYLPVGFGLPGASLEMAFSTYKAMNGKHTAGGMFADTVRAITSNSLPIQAADGSILREDPLAWAFLSGSPELLQPATEVTFNRKAYGGSPVFYGETPKDQRDSVQGSPRTSDAAKSTADILYNITGGAADMRPESLQHLAENYFGYGPLRALPIALKDGEEKTGGLNVTNAEQSGVLGALTSWDIGVDRNALQETRLVWDMTKRADDLGKKYNIPISDSDRDPKSKESALASYRRRLTQADVPITDAEFMYNSQAYLKQQQKLKKAYNEAQEAYNEARKAGDGAEAEYENMAAKWFALENLAHTYLEENNDYF